MKNYKNHSEFTGTAGGWVGTAIIGFILTVVTCGIAIPWVMCMYLNYYFDNAVIQGRRMMFCGTEASLSFNSNTNTGRFLPPSPQEIYEI